jgi:hypothetical protein
LSVITKKTEKMKSLIFTLALIFSFVSYSQKLEIDKESGKYSMVGIEKIDGVSKEVIFDKIYRYIVLNYSNVDNLIVQTNGEVFSFYALVSKTNNVLGWKLKHKMFIEVKDGKFRYTFTNFTYNENEFETKVFVGRQDAIEKTEFELGNLIIRLTDICRNPENW